MFEEAMAAKTKTRGVAAAFSRSGVRQRPVLVNQLTSHVADAVLGPYGPLNARKFQAQRSMCNVERGQRMDRAWR